MAIFGPKPPGVVRVRDPLKNPFFGVFWKSAKKPSFSRLDFGHLKKAQKKGHFWVFPGGSKMEILGKIGKIGQKAVIFTSGILRFSVFTCFFLWFFGHFCQFLDPPGFWGVVIFGYLTTFWTNFWTPFYHFFEKPI